MGEKANIVIGAYYELPGGTVARTFGWNGETRTVSYALDDGFGGRTAPEAAVARDWVRREDLADFPNARDPVLPHTFDLFWDAKRRSDLPPLLADPETAAEVAEAMRDHGITLGEAELQAVEDLKAAAGRMP